MCKLIFQFIFVFFVFLLLKMLCKKSIRIKLYMYYCLFFLVTFTWILYWPYYLLHPGSTKNAIISTRIIKFVAKYTDLKWELRNSNILSKDRAAIIVSNHQSMLDILGMFIIWEVADKMTATGKKELFYLWPLGLTFYLTSAVLFIDRKDAKNAYKKLRTAVKKLRASNTKIWIFPEGTRNKDLHKLLPFKKGAFSTAVEAQLPIIPIVFSPYHFFTKGNEALLLHGPIVVECLEPEPTVGLTAEDVPVLAERVRARMQAKYDQLYEELLSNKPESYKEFSRRPVLQLKNE